MSDSCVTVVRIDPLDAEAAGRLAAVVTRRLRAEGVLGEPDDGERPVLAVEGERLWRPGPALAGRSLAPERPAAGLVGVSDRRHLHHAFANAGPPVCRGCGAALDDDEDGQALGTWVETGEPDLVCRACGWRAPYGDWAGDWAGGSPSTVGAPAVSFHLDDDPAPPLLEHVRDLLGGRSVVVHVHL